MKRSVRHKFRFHPVRSTPTASHHPANYILLSRFLWTGKMAQIIRALAAKPDDLSLLPQNLIEGADGGFSVPLQCELRSLCPCPPSASLFQAPVVSLESQGPTEASHPCLFFFF